MRIAILTLALSAGCLMLNPGSVAAGGPAAPALLEHRTATTPTSNLVEKVGGRYYGHRHRHRSRFFFNFGYASPFFYGGYYRPYYYSYYQPYYYAPRYVYRKHYRHRHRHYRRHRW